MYKTHSRYLLAFVFSSLFFGACQKPGSGDGKPQKVIVELQVGYDPRLVYSSSTLNFYFTRKVGTLAHDILPNRVSFDTSFAVYMQSGDSLKMVDPRDSLYGVFLINNTNNTRSFKSSSGSLVYYYVQP